MAALLENVCHYQNEGEIFVESIVRGSPQSEKGTPRLGNIPIHPLGKGGGGNPAICEKKTMASVFWDCEALLPPRTTINSDKYCETLKKLCEAIEQESPGQLTAGA
jgi:hypothetical protein